MLLRQATTHPSADHYPGLTNAVLSVIQSSHCTGSLRLFNGMLDSIYCTPFNLSDGVQSFLPPDPTHTAFVTGKVTSVDISEPATRSFTLTVSEYVRDECCTFDIRSVFS